ncbi:MAG: hypothetical protein ACLQBB_12945, partial [Solirubrobacteraceae bacterium]
MSEFVVHVRGELHRLRLARQPSEGLAASWCRLARIVCLGLVIACASPAAASATTGGTLYWTSPSTGAIMRAEAGGSTPQTVLKAEKLDSGIAVAAGKIYWSWAEGIGRANLDGSEADPSFIKGGEGITGLAVAGEHIYWGGPGGKIGRANLNGTGVEAEFIKEIAGGTVIGLAANSEYLYWTNFWHSAIGRAKLNGSSVEQEFIQKTHTPMGLTLNEEYLYWAITYENHIGRALLGGSEANVNFITTGLSSEGNEQVGVAVDSGHIYWANPNTGTIGRANINGGEIEPSFITGAGDPLGLTLVGAPVRVDPFALEEKLSYSATPDAGEAPAGATISANGNTAVVGASQPAPGAVYVYQRGANGLWTLQQTISPGGSDGYSFGSHVALSEDGKTLLVTGGTSSDLGHVWTYTLHEGVWTPDAETLDDPIKTNPAYDHDKPGFLYGNALAISGNGSVALVADEPQGAAVLYHRVGAGWEEVTSFSDGKGEPSEYGIAIALSGNGHDALVAAPSTELVYSYSDSGGSWKQTGTFPYFAYDGQRNVSVAIDGEGDTAIAGEYLSGTARVWHEKPGSGAWEEQAKLTEPVGPSQAEFGSDVSLSGSGSKALILAFGGEGVVAYEYTRAGSTWSQQSPRLEAPIESPGRGIGYIPEVALSAEGDTALLWSKFTALPAIYTDAPVVGIGVASELGTATATLKGTVYPAEEKVTSCRFEYGTSLSYGSTKACSVTPEGSVTVPVSAGVTGLSSSTTYHFRLAVTTAAGTFDSGDATFTTFKVFATAKTEEASKPQTATLGSVSATPSGGIGSVTVGSYSANVGEPPLPSSTGSYLDVYRSTGATFKEIEIKACELKGAKALWAYGKGGWEPVSPAATLSEGCLTFTANASSRPSVAELEGFKYKTGEPAGQFGECRAKKDAVYSEGGCLTVHESKGAPDGKGKYEWYAAVPGTCFPQKKGEFEEGACKTTYEKKGKPAGKYEVTNGSFTSSAPGAVLEVGSEKIECTGVTGTGEFFSPEKGSETLTLTGCGQKGTSCSSAGAAAGTVVSFPLEVIVLQSATSGEFELALAAAQ